MDCCCGGGTGDHVTVKEENCVEKHLLPLCRDDYIKHPIRTKACEELASFPSSIPLYSGIHGEVVISTQPRWLSHANTSNPNNSLDSIGTQVLIPVGGGLIELFSSKMVPKDDKITEFIATQYKISVEEEAMSAQSYANEQPHQPFLDECLNNWQASHHYMNFNPRLQLVPTVSPPSTFPSLEGSSTGSNPSKEHSSTEQPIGKNSETRKPNCVVNFATKQEINFVSGFANHPIRTENLKAGQKTQRQPYQSKNLETERNRRNRIKDGLFALRALVPKISKMDKASILGDAIEHIQELQKNVDKLEGELREMTEDDCNKKNAEVVVTKLIEAPESTQIPPATKNNQSSSSFGENKQLEVSSTVEVSQIGARYFLLKLISKHKRGGFAVLMEALNSLELQVIDANVTTCNGMASNILVVEANRAEVQPNHLKASLIKLSS
ncbi:unnamed protein product [Ilex paraguariensis]